MLRHTGFYIRHRNKLVGQMDNLDRHNIRHGIQQEDFQNNSDLWKYNGQNVNFHRFRNQNTIFWLTLRKSYLWTLAYRMMIWNSYTLSTNTALWTGLLTLEIFTVFLVSTFVIGFASEKKKQKKIYKRYSFANFNFIFYNWKVFRFEILKRFRNVF